MINSRINGFDAQDILGLVGSGRLADDLRIFICTRVRRCAYGGDRDTFHVSSTDDFFIDDIMISAGRDGLLHKNVFFDCTKCFYTFPDVST